jgi:hypothetical protein
MFRGIAQNYAKGVDMEFARYFSEVSPTFLGIIVGSLFTVVGVILTNVSNTRRLRLQHEHERNLESKERDATMRRETYLGAIEAISAGMVAVGRFGEYHFPPHELMAAYTNKSPAIAKVMMVGKNELLKAVANFNSELTGTFIRLTSKRQNLHMVMERTAALEKEMQSSTAELHRIQALVNEERVRTEDADDQLQLRYDEERQHHEQLVEKQQELWNWQFQEQMNLVKQSLKEVERLDGLLTPVIGLMREELELPFDQEAYNQILAENHQKQLAFLDSFMQEQSELMQEE